MMNFTRTPSLHGIHSCGDFQPGHRRAQSCGLHCQSDRNVHVCCGIDAAYQMLRRCNATKLACACVMLRFSFAASLVATLGHHQGSTGSTACRPCDSGKYQPELGAAKCISCEAGHNSTSGSAACTMCSRDFFRPDAGSPVTACTSCDEIPSVSCGQNTTTRTLTINHGYWRHSTATLETWRCVISEGWSPCRGGDEAGHSGDGYCAPGYFGPRCELCNSTVQEAEFFDELNARCRSCSELTTTNIITLCFLGIVVAVASVVTAAARLDSRSAAPLPLLRKFRGMRKIWRRAGMQFKVKALVGLYQCVGAVPSVFDVTTPSGLDGYARWISFLEMSSSFGSDAFVSPSCVGSYRVRLWVGSCWPIVLLLCVTSAAMVWEVTLDRWKNPSLVARRGYRAAMNTGLFRALPLTLMLTFLLLPSTSTRIFKAFLCDPIDYGAGVTKRYLHADLALSCDSDEYTVTQIIAGGFILVWPLGVVALYAVLLWLSREALRTGRHTPLSKAIAFLSGDYKRSTYWWEPLEMCRKLTLTGWVLLLSEETEQARVIVALLVSISFLALHFSIMPFQRYALPRIARWLRTPLFHAEPPADPGRPEDSLLMVMIELSLIFIYICVLLIKSCDMSSVRQFGISKATSRQTEDFTKAVCMTFGFGENASGQRAA